MSPLDHGVLGSVNMALLAMLSLQKYSKIENSSYSENLIQSKPGTLIERLKDSVQT